MHWSSNVLLASLTLTAPSVSTPAFASDGDAVAAFPIESKVWFNHIGQPISVESLRGRTILVEIWATWCPPCREAMPHLDQLQEEFGDQGLVVLALSDEEPEKVEGFVSDTGLHMRVAADCKSGSAYMSWAGANGIPHSFLVDPKGNIMWHGHPGELTEGTIKEALKGARKATGAAALQLNLAIDAPGKASKLVDLAAEGSLAKALAGAAAIGADARATEPEKSAALDVTAKIEGHVADVLSQVDGFLERRDVLPARDALQVLTKELDGLPLAAGAVEREKKLHEDPALSKELAASEELQSILQAAAKRGLDKAKDKLDAFAKKNAGTRAGDQARKLVVRL